MNSVAQNDYIEVPREAYLTLTGGERSDGVAGAATVLPEHRPIWFSSLELTQVLRWCGGILLGTAGIAFMFQGVYSFSPMTRHWMMLATCVLLALLGAVTGSLMKEIKGARTFFGFATASFPVLASQMGAMVFSLFGHPPEGMPQPLVFSLPNLWTVSAIVAATLVITTIISYFGFRILARHKAGLMIAGVAAVHYWIDAAVLSKEFRIDNFEGRICRALLTAPLLVMIGRNLFYPVSAGYAAMVLGMIGVYLSFRWGRKVSGNVARPLIQFSGMGTLVTAWFVFILPSLAQIHFGEGMALYLVLLPTALVVGLHALTVGAPLAKTFCISAVMIAVAGVLAAHLIDASPVVSLVGIVVSLTVIALGVLTGGKLISFAGCVAALTSMGNVALKAITCNASYTWVMFAAVGILVLLSASLAERGRGGFQQRVLALWGKLGK